MLGRSNPSCNYAWAPICINVLYNRETSRDTYYWPLIGRVNCLPLVRSLYSVSEGYLYPSAPWCRGDCRLIALLPNFQANFNQISPRQRRMQWKEVRVKFDILPRFDDDLYFRLCLGTIYMYSSQSTCLTVHQTLADRPKSPRAVNDIQSSSRKV